MVNPRKRSFELLARSGDRRLFTAHWGHDNGDWMHALTDKDMVVFSDVWTPSGSAAGTRDLLKDFKYPENVYFLCNDYDVYEDRLAHGLQAIYINQNAFVDENINYVIHGAAKKYDAIYNGRFVPMKRHYLARKVGKEVDLALLVGRHTPQFQQIPDDEVPQHVYMNPSHVMRETVNKLNNASRVGLILSEVEGGCFASSEYLLAGIPVVSTPSRGGRAFWYDDYNSIVCEPTEEAVRDAVLTLLNEPRDPYRIREGHLRKMFAHRQKYVDLILRKFFKPGEVNEAQLDTVFDRLNFNRYQALQSKYSWKTVESIITFLREERNVYDDEPERFDVGINFES